MKIVNISEIKNKFGRLLSYAYNQCNIDIDILSEQIIQNDFFDFLERNDCDDLLRKSIPELTLIIFNSERKTNDETISTSLLYAGESYITCSISLSIPLRKLFLLFPLNKMLDLFPSYHEQAPFKLIERVNEEISTKTSLSILLKRSDYTIASLSRILNINRRFVISLYDSSLNEKKIDYPTMKLLCKLLNCNPVFFSESSFIPYYYGLWNDEIFVDLIKKYLQIILVTSFEVILDIKDKPSNKSFILLSNAKAVIYDSQNRIVRKVGNEKLDLAIELAIKEYKTYCLNNKIAFC